MKSIRFMTIILIFLLAGSIMGPAQTTVTAAEPKAAESKSSLAPTSSIGILDIPLSDAGFKLDGLCGDAVYAGAVPQIFTDGGGSGTVLIVHTATKLLVCMTGTAGTFNQRSGAVYLDPQGDGNTYTYAAKNDYRLQVGILSGSNTSYHGTDVADGYVLDAAVSGFWSGTATTDPKNDIVEYEINLAGFGIGACSQVFGLAVYHHNVAATGDDYGWPSNKFYDQPKTWQLMKLVNGPCGVQPKGPVAYVFRGELPSAVSFYNLLSSAGYGVTLVPLSDVAATNFSVFTLILIADDTGYLDTWGTPPAAISTDQVNKIKAANKPILGLGEGGYAFFGRLGLFIGWPQGWHGPQEKMWKEPTSPAPIFAGTTTDPINHYLSPQNSVGIYLGIPPIPLPPGVVPFAWEDPKSTNHDSLIIQGCRMLWGNSGNPYQMTVDGKTVFLNSVAYMFVFQCPPPPPPVNDCFLITKTANPASGSTVLYGDVITYTLTYSFVAGQGCPAEARLIDKIPVGAMFIPGSAGSATPAADGTLNWVITSGDSPKQKSFSVRVTQQNCPDQKTAIINSATITAYGQPNLDSVPTSHAVTCPPISLPNEDPPYIESEIQVHPYPLVAGRASQVSVRLTNTSAVVQPVVVNFETSPTGFGIGLAFTPFASVPATLPAGGSAVLSANLTPPASGQYSIQIRVTGTNFPNPVITQHNLDVMEDLHPGVASPLTFSVRNDSALKTTITLVVDNSCPGWTAVVSPSTMTGMTPGEIRTATLTVTPPSGASILGSGCHIDVQAWDGTRLVGGIRKLDVPIVNLPVGVLPPWEEPEISFIPSVPVAGATNQICVELQNPSSSPRTVTILYEVADFGGGIGFTTVASRTVNLPAHSIDKYCVPWATVGSGTLHRCVLVVLHQAGYQDMHSQRNIDILPASTLGTFEWHFLVGNPDLAGHLLTLRPLTVGIDPYWRPVIETIGGGLPPAMLNPGESAQLRLKLLPAVAMSPLAPPANPFFGSQRKVEVAVLFDGMEYSGFSVKLDYMTYIPKISR